MDTSESGLEVDFERGADFDSEFVSLQGGAQLFYTPPCQHCQCHNQDSRGPTTTITHVETRMVSQRTMILSRLD